MFEIPGWDDNKGSCVLAKELLPVEKTLPKPQKPRKVPLTGIRKTKVVKETSSTLKNKLKGISNLKKSSGKKRKTVDANSFEENAQGSPPSKKRKIQKSTENNSTLNISATEISCEGGKTLQNVECTGRASKRRLKRIKKRLKISELNGPEKVVGQKTAAENGHQTCDDAPTLTNFFPTKRIAKLRQVLQNCAPLEKETKEKPDFKTQMIDRLKASRFRFLNEKMYTSTSQEATQMFKGDPDSFRTYHEGYQGQVSKWNIDPLDVIIKAVVKLSKSLVVADFGCGSARLAQSVPNKVHSFDIIALSKYVTACDMANTPLADSSVDIVVFCLSLMGTNRSDYILEANRVLKIGGLMKIAEVESRFTEEVPAFVEKIERFGFKNLALNVNHKMFVFMDFQKTSTVRRKNRMPPLVLRPCLYKKR